MVLLETINYEKELNPAQYKAVSCTKGPYLVIAGAGSGKTRVLVYRVAYLVEQGVDPSNILLLTFTRKASEQMLFRASKILDDRCRKVSGGTFHSFANMILRRYGSYLNITSNFVILDQSDAQNVVNLVRNDLGYNKADKRFPRKGAILDMISKSINKGEDVRIIVDCEYPHLIEYADDIRKIKDKYIKYKHSKSLMDYDDLLVFLKILLQSNEDIRKRLSKQYNYIMVDEYQDTNKIQAEILQLLASEHKNIMVVGDDSQSIYSFRGANFKNIIDFPKVFDGTKVITLEENYRSVQPILDLTNKVISNALEKFDKNLFTSRAGKILPVFYDAINEVEQSNFIIEKISELVSEGIELGEIAVLFRSGWHSNNLEVMLSKNNIPFAKYGGIKFVDSAHIKDMLAYLRIVHNRSDVVSWHRILLLHRGIGKRGAEQLVSKILTSKDLSALLEDKLIKKYGHIKQLIELLKDIDSGEYLPVEVLKKFFNYYNPIFKDSYDDYNKRLGDLDSLERICVNYASIEELLTDLALEPPENNIVNNGQTVRDSSQLVLSTIHSAKGLEWHTVFLIYVADGHIPSYQSFADDGAIEEERRLFYVAMTRAKDRLYLLKPLVDRSPKSYYMKGDGSIFTKMSRFLDEVGMLSDYIDIEVRDNYDEALF